MMIDQNHTQKQIDFSTGEILGASGIYRPPVLKRTRFLHRWALPHQAPLCRPSRKNRKHGRKMRFKSIRHEMDYRAWASRLAASNLAAEIKRRRDNGLVRYDISHRDRITVKIFADVVKVKRSGNDSRGGGGLRGEVAGFSHESRRRMMEALASTKDLDQRPGLFITLTYPDLFIGDPERWHRDLDTLLKRLRRNFPRVGWFWRLEMVERQSGFNKGIYAPHFHLLVFMEQRYKGKELRWLRLWFSLAWYEIVGSFSLDHKKAGTNVRTIYNRAHAMRYCSKYAAKEAHEEIVCGRRWGMGGELDRAPMWVSSLSMRAYIAFKRYAVRLLESRGRRYAKRLKRSSMLGGFTVFGFGAQSMPEWKTIFSSSVYSLLIDAVSLARSHPREMAF